MRNKNTGPFWTRHDREARKREVEATERYTLRVWVDYFATHTPTDEDGRPIGPAPQQTRETFLFDCRSMLPPREQDMIDSIRAKEPSAWGFVFTCQAPNW